MKWNRRVLEAIIAQDVHFRISILLWHRNFKDLLVKVFFVLFGIDNGLPANWAINIVRLKIPLQAILVDGMFAIKDANVLNRGIHVLHADWTILLKLPGDTRMGVFRV